MTAATATKKRKTKKKKKKKKKAKVAAKKKAEDKARAKAKKDAEKLEAKRVKQITAMAKRKEGVTRQQAMARCGISYGQTLRLFKVCGLVCTGANGKQKVFTLGK